MGSSVSRTGPLTGWGLRLSKLFIIPQRYVLAIMGMFATCNAYTMRVCLNLVITQMATSNDPNVTSHYDPDACPTNDELSSSNSSSSAVHEHQFIWSEATQGLLLSAFFYGYVVTHIPGGMLAERYGGKWVLGIGLLSTAICTLITPITVNWGGHYALFILRVIEGFGEGPTMPGLMAVLSRWAPKAERALFGAIVFGGAQIGNIAGLYMSGVLLAGGGSWENVFYLFGGFGVLWFILWTLLCYSDPSTHPFISDSEKEFLKVNMESANVKHRLGTVPWKAMLRSVPLWTLVVAGIGHDWGYFTMVTDLPKYMTDVLKFNIKQAGTLTAMPYLAMWLTSFVFGIICDFCVKRGYHSILTARKIYTTIAATGPGICIIVASYTGCNRYAAVGLFILAMMLMGAYYSGMKINALDITPNYAGTTTAIVNGIAAIAGIITPYLVGLLTPDQTLVQWRHAFWICFAVLVITNIVYLIWAQGEQQWWDDVKKHGYPENWKHGPLPETDVNLDNNPSNRTRNP